MTLDEFERSATRPGAPPALPPPLLALWHDACGDWDAAHRAVQGEPGADAAWVHAYLHRKEGDASNAGYWYQRAGRAPAGDALAQEWRAVAAALLDAARG